MNQPGKSLGVIGLGGLGHMAVKFGKAFGLKVTVFSTSESKRAQAIDLLGADNFVISSDKQQMEVSLPLISLVHLTAVFNFSTSYCHYIFNDIYYMTFLSSYVLLTENS
jgi:cinnamyl-alcohol dehydrogenase